MVLFFLLLSALGQDAPLEETDLPPAVPAAEEAPPDEAPDELAPPEPVIPEPLVPPEPETPVEEEEVPTPPEAVPEPEPVLPPEEEADPVQSREEQMLRIELLELKIRRVMQDLAKEGEDPADGDTDAPSEEK